MAVPLILIGIDRLGLLLQNGGCQPFGGSECQWLMRLKNLIQDTHRFRTLSFLFAFLLLTRPFGIMRDFAG